MSDAVERARSAALALTPGEWARVRRDVDEEFASQVGAKRAETARELARQMDMTPEGYVREWAARGRKDKSPLPPWERAYQDAGLIEQARILGYIEIGRGARSPVTLTAAGEALLDAREEPETVSPSP